MKIVHLSDLHFGTTCNDLTFKLIRTLHRLHPDLIIISGDLTQIASTEEYLQAQRFIHDLCLPVVSIPGNHDVSPYNLLERLTKPFSKYKRYIHDNLNPVIQNDTSLVAGINSARRALPHWNWANGAVSCAQRQRINDVFSNSPSDLWRIATLHHPVHKVQTMPIDVTVFGADKTLKCFAQNKIDLVLTGHVHQASVTTIDNAMHQTVYLSASTSLSARTRSQENGFNLITLDNKTMSIEIYKYKNAEFASAESHTYNRSAS